MSSSDTSTAMKSCCACGVDVTGQPRMKDSQSRYWCMPCGQADQKRKMAASTHLACAGCRKLLPKGKLDKHGEYFYCKPCLKQRTKAAAAEVEASAATSSSSSGSPAIAARTRHSGMTGAATAESGERRRVMMMMALLVTLILISVLFNYVFAE